MKLWPTCEWSATIVRSDGNATRVAIKTPFALIGSHAACNIRVDSPRIPPIAYLVVAFQHGLEIWPLCAIAYPKWGALQNDEQIRLGSGYTVKFSFPQKRTPSNVTNETAGSRESSSKLIFEINGVGKSIRISRLVSIIGSHHPSTIRIAKQGLARCDHALICVDGKSWLIQLHPTENAKFKDLIQQVLPGELPIKIGKLKISDGSPVCNDAEPTQASPSQQAVDSPDSNAELKGISALAGKSLADRIERSQETTTQVTNRLMEINRIRWSRSRLINFSLLTTLFLATGYCLAWIVLKYLLPSLANYWGN